LISVRRFIIGFVSVIFLLYSNRSFSKFSSALFSCVNKFETDIISPLHIEYGLSILLWISKLLFLIPIFICANISKHEFVDISNFENGEKSISISSAITVRSSAKCSSTVLLSTFWTLCTKSCLYFSDTGCKHVWHIYVSVFEKISIISFSWLLLPVCASSSK